MKKNDTVLSKTQDKGTSPATQKLPFVGKRIVILCAASVAAVAGFSVGTLTRPSPAEAAVQQAPRLLAPNASTVSIPDLVERVSPAVVSILVEREVEQRPSIDPFQEFFQFRFGEPMPERRGPGRGQRDEPETRRLSSQGSGFFINQNGHIVTNNHVVEGSDVIKVRLSNGDELEATLIGSDELTDLAVVKVEPIKDQSFVTFADDVNLRVGETVVAVGNPFGLGGTVTSGIISAIGGENRQGQFLDYIQIDAPINRGNSGGPTFDLQGRVVGVNTAIYSPTGGSVGIGFAIPARVASATVQQLINDGAVTRGWLGVSLRELDSNFAAALGRETTSGAFLEDVLDDTPARKAGLEAGDLIVAIDGKDIIDTNELSRTISSYAPGETVKVTFLREGKEKTLRVKLGKRPNETGTAEEQDDSRGSDASDDMERDLGFGVSTLDAPLRARFRLDTEIDGVVITDVARNSAASEAGLRPGVVILEVDGEPIATRQALKTKVVNAAKAGREAVLLRVQIGSSRRFTALPIDNMG
ncbi:MAG: Do family serine endopeptidase [Pseudomonadota bacterium]